MTRPAHRKPRRLPRHRGSREIFEAILTASAELVAERGLHGLTTNHVAKRAGVSVGSLYRYFPDKGSIVAALNLRYRRAAAQRFLTTLATLESDFDGTLRSALLDFLSPPPEGLAVRSVFMRSVPLEWIETSATEIWTSLVRPAAAALRRLRPTLDEDEALRRVTIALHAAQGVGIAIVVWAPDQLSPETAASELARILTHYLLA